MGRDRLNAMAQSLHQRAEALVSSVWLTAANRIGVPLILAAVLWGGSTVLALENRMHQAEAKDNEITRRVQVLEERRERDRDESTQRETSLRALASDIRTDLAGLRAQQDATLRALTRVEQYIDRRGGN